MSNEIAKLVVAFEAQTAQYVKAMDQLKQQNARFHSDTQSTINKVKNAFSALGGAVIVEQAFSFIKSQIETVSAIGKVAEAAGLGAEQLQRLQFAFKNLTTLSDQSVQQGLNMFNKNLGLARDSSQKLRAAFVSLGVDIRQTTGVALEQAIVGLSKIEDSSKRAEKAGLLFSARFGPKMAGALAQGLDTFNRVRDSLQSLVTQKDIDAARKLEETFSAVSKAFTVGAATEITKNADALMAAANGLGIIFGWMMKILGAAHDFGDFMGKWIYRGENSLPSNAGGEPSGLQSSADLPDWMKPAYGSVQNSKTKGTAAAPAGISDSQRVAAEAAIDKMLEDEHTGFLATIANLDAKAQQKAREDAGKSQLEAWNASDKLDQEAYQRKLDLALKNAAEIIDKNHELINKGAQENAENIAKTFNDEYKSMTVFAEEAARNMQDAFANFLFDPFEGGIKGMLTGFIDVLRRMAAEMAASEIFKYLGSFKGASGALGLIGSFFSNANPSHAAVGGSFSGGHPILVGERGPEMFIPSSSGSIVPNSALGGGVTINQSFTVGDVATRSQLVAGMSMAKDSAKKEIFDLIRRGRV